MNTIKGVEETYRTDTAVFNTLRTVLGDHLQFIDQINIVLISFNTLKDGFFIIWMNTKLRIKNGMTETDNMNNIHE